jgi:3',5'-cyclic AMP phosphodiesterase CpdA
LAFRNFRSDLEASTGQDLIVIPGNHDEKIRGNALRGIGQRLDEVANLEWSSLVIDDAMQCVFYCLDSSKDAPNFARGRVTRQQMMDIATLFETKAAAKPVIRDYLSIALIHHHPYSFKAKTETRIQKTLGAVGLDEEQFLRMDDADQFLSWCVGRRVPLILHGHKHVALHVTDTIEWKRRDGRWMWNVTGNRGASIVVQHSRMVSLHTEVDRIVFRRSWVWYRV